MHGVDSFIIGTHHGDTELLMLSVFVLKYLSGSCYIPGTCRGSSDSSSAEQPSIDGVFI